MVMAQRNLQAMTDMKAYRKDKAILVSEIDRSQSLHAAFQWSGFLQVSWERQDVKGHTEVALLMFTGSSF